MTSARSPHLVLYVPIPSIMALCIMSVLAMSIMLECHPDDIALVEFDLVLRAKRAGLGIELFDHCFAHPHGDEYPVFVIGALAR